MCRLGGGFLSSANEAFKAAHLLAECAVDPSCENVNGIEKQSNN